jgi:HEAT repeat protein
MRKCLYIVMAAMLVIAIGVAIWGWRRRPEPIYEGRRATLWIANPLYAGPRNRATAPESMLNDSNAIPFLVNALQRRENWLDYAHRWAYFETPAGMREAMHLEHPASALAMRLNAAEILGQMKEAARPAIPALARTLRTDGDPEVRRYAANALGRIGRGDGFAIAALTEALKDGNFQVRISAAGNLLLADAETARKAGVSTNSPFFGMPTNIPSR